MLLKKASGHPPLREHSLGEQTCFFDLMFIPTHPQLCMLDTKETFYSAFLPVLVASTFLNEMKLVEHLCSQLYSSGCFVCHHLDMSFKENPRKSTKLLMFYLEFCFLRHVCEFSDVFRNVAWDMLPVSQL